MYTYNYREERRKASRWEKTRSSLVQGIVTGVEYFCLKTSMHGFSQIAAPRRHWVERFLWIVACAFAIWGTVDLTLDQLKRYEESPTVVTLEKDFRSWQFNLPGITICKEDKVDRTRLPTVIKSHWNSDPGDDKYEYYTRFVNAVANSDIYHLDMFHEFKDDASLNVDFYNLSVEVTSELPVKTTISEKVVLQWTPVMTEAGICHTTNSLALHDVAIVKPTANETGMYPVSCKYSAQTCSVMFAITVPAFFYIHSPYGIVDVSFPPTKVWRTSVRNIELSVMESRCGRGVKDLSPRRRGCLYTDEPSESGKKVYSTNACRLACRRKLAQKLCGCVPFYYFYDVSDGPPCSVSGMKCLSHHSEQLLHSAGQCTCTPQCVSSVYRELGNEQQTWSSSLLGVQGNVKYVLLAPRTRYTREIVFHFQDLIVSFGGATGLFLGASFISLFEIFYFIMAKIITYSAKYTSLEHSATMSQDFTANSGRDAKHIQRGKVPFETVRIMELNYILDNERRYLEEEE